MTPNNCPVRAITSTLVPVDRVSLGFMNVPQLNPKPYGQARTSRRASCSPSIVHLVPVFTDLFFHIAAPERLPYGPQTEVLQLWKRGRRIGVDDAGLHRNSSRGCAVILSQPTHRQTECGRPAPQVATHPQRQVDDAPVQAHQLECCHRSSCRYVRTRTATETAKVMSPSTRATKTNRRTGPRRARSRVPHL